MSLVVGSKVEGNYRGKGTWYPGTIAVIQDDGTVDIHYDDGEVEHSISREMVRLFENIANITGLAVGAKIESNFKGVGKYYPGTIARVNTNGQSFFIKYDDGETEDNVSVNMIRVSGKSNLPKSPELKLSGKQEGAKIEGNYRGKGKWYPGVISKVRPNGTFDIDYDDGEEESEVPEDMIRFTSSPRTSTKTNSVSGFLRGSKVEGNYQNKGVWLPATITVVQEDHTYNLFYDNGENEDDVPSSLIRLATAQVGERGFTEGAAVEANYRGRGKYWPGRIKIARDNGTYDIGYDDGEFETSVTADMLRLLTEKANNASSSTSVSSNSKLTVGTVVEANYQSSGTYFPGKISKVRGDGTFDVDYDDGESEISVSSARIRLPRPDVPIPEGTLIPGVCVEGNYRGRGIYFPGKVSRDNGDGTFCIKYEDGEVELKVAVKNIRLTEEVASTPNNVNNTTCNGEYKVGSKIEGNYRKCGQWFTGTITKIHANNTCNIHYDDGEDETNVERARIRDRSDAPFVMPANPVVIAGLNKGVKVEGNFAGQGKWYPGTITLDRGDGTFDIHYDDDEKESRVAAALIRPIAPINKVPALAAPLQSFTPQEMTALRALLLNNNSNNNSNNTMPSGSGGNEEGSLSSPRGTLQKALIASRQLELDAMEHAISSLQSKNSQFVEHVRVLSDEIAAMKVREGEMLNRIKELEQRI